MAIDVLSFAQQPHYEPNLAGLEEDLHCVAKRLRVRARTVAHQDREDALSVGYELMFTKRLHFAERDDRRAWLYSAAMFCLANERRKAKRRQIVDTIEAENISVNDTRVLDFERRDYLDLVLQVLSKDERDLLYHHYVEGRPMREIAVLLHDSTPRLESRSKRALKKVRKNLKKYR